MNKGRTLFLNLTFRNKKGSVDDLLDYFIIVFTGVFIMFFLSFAFTSGFSQSKEVSLNKFAEYKKNDAAVNNLRVNLDGIIINDINDINEKIDNSNLVDGRVITICSDYIKKESCNAEVAKVVKEVTLGCFWIVDECKLRAKRAYR